MSDLCEITKKNGLSTIIIIFLMGVVVYQSYISRNFAESTIQNTRVMADTLSVVGNKYETYTREIVDLEYKIEELKLMVTVINAKADKIIEKGELLEKKENYLFDKVDTLKTVTVYENQVTRAGGKK